MKETKLIYLISAALFCVAMTSCDRKSMTNSNTDSTKTIADSENKARHASFVGMPNPWTDTNSAEAEKTAGFTLGIPEGATDIIYRILKSEKLVEMDFRLYGERWTARTKPAADTEDISGMYFKWSYDSAADTAVLPLPGKERRAESSGKHILSALWFDKENSRVYSLSVSASEKQPILPAKTIFGPALKK